MDKTLRDKSVSEILGFAGNLALVALALLGMAGLLYHTLAPGGLVGAWLDRLWASHPAFTILVLLGLGTMALAARAPGRASRAVGYSDAPLYIFVSLGTLFAARLVLNGTL
jgi:fumarate reductase subunit C